MSGNADLPWTKSGISLIYPYSALANSEMEQPVSGSSPALFVSCMKIAIISPYATVVPHFETELDIAQQHLSVNDQVVFLNCHGELANCDFNPDKDPERCRSCVGRREMGLELLSPRAEIESIKTLEQLNFQDELARIASIEELLEWKVERFEIGYAVVSSLVSHCRDPLPSIESNRALIERLAASSIQMYYETQRFIDQQRPDLIYVFNGRFAAMRAVFRAAESRGVDCLIHERGCDEKHFSLMKNNLPHDIKAISNTILTHWSQRQNDSKAIPLAETWFRERFDRVERTWHSFTKEQAAGRLPESWDPARHNITIFTSSDDEFVAIGDCWKNELYSDQTGAIKQICRDLLCKPEIQITVRMHPNLKGIEHQKKREMLGLESANLRIVPPESNVDSYALIEASETIATFGSTIGIEAVFWGRPSVLLGPSMYQDLGGTYRPRDHCETLNCLSRQLPVQDKLGAYKFGYFLQTFGVPFQYFESKGLFEGTFKSQTLYARPPKKTLRTRIKNELASVSRKISRIIGSQP